MFDNFEHMGYTPVTREYNYRPFVRWFGQEQPISQKSSAAMSKEIDWVAVISSNLYQQETFKKACEVTFNESNTR